MSLQSDIGEIHLRVKVKSRLTVYVKARWLKIH